MRKTLLAGLLAVAAVKVFAADGGAPLRGGMCYSPNAMLSGANTFFNRDHIGRVKHIKEIYEKGFRVVSSGFVPKEAGGGISTGFFL